MEFMRGCPTSLDCDPVAFCNGLDAWHELIYMNSPVIKPAGVHERDYYGAFLTACQIVLVSTSRIWLIRTSSRLAKPMAPCLPAFRPIRHCIPSVDQIEDGTRLDLRGLTDPSVGAKKEVVGFLLAGIVSI
jgi:hypothetical protein